MQMPGLSEGDLDTLLEEVGLKEAARRLQSRLIDEKNRSRKLVEATQQGAYDAMVALGPISAIPAPPKDSRRNPESALWDLGDWQGSKVTTTYNTDIMIERVHRYVNKAEHLTTIQQAHHPVTECTIIFGGDMVEGLFNFPTQPFEIDQTIFGQYVHVSRLLVDVVRRALAIYPLVKIVPEWGNHGRVGSKRSAVPRSDNIDRMCYELARQLLAGEERLIWPDCPEDIQYFEIGNYAALALHGDEPGRSGFVSPPVMVQYITRLQSGAYHLPFRDAYIHHYHNHSEYALPNGRGAAFYNGSTESDNRYARDGMAATAIPSQRLHFIDMERGRVSNQYHVYVDED